MNSLNSVKNINLNLNKTDKIIKVISDYEGQKIPDAKYNEHYIICGDIIDSTVGGGGSLDLSKYIFGGHQKHFNIRNIQKIINQPNNYTLIFGNRDVNKFKVGILSILNRYNTDITTRLYNSYIDKFNDGTFNLNDYDNLKKESNVCWITSSKNWLPFWNGQLTDNLLNGKGIEDKYNGIWSKDDKCLNNLITPFLDRFNRIFGVDGSIGTMSAGNLLYTIPKELTEMENTFTDEIKNKLLNTNDDNKDFLAFVTLLVFRLMFQTRMKKDHINITNDNKLNISLLHGLLHKLYTSNNAIFTGYLEYSDKLIIFSHGGISSMMIDEEFLNKFFELKTHIKNNSKKLTQTGGNDNEYNSIHIINSLINIEKTYYNLLKDALNDIRYIDNIIPTKSILLFLSLTAAYKPNGSNDFILMSPINPGIDNIKNNKFFCSDKKLIQVFGHVPKGYGTGLYQYIQNNNELNIINLDISQSFKYSGLAGNTYNELKIQNGIIKIVTNLFLLDKSKNKIYINDEEISYLDPYIISINDKLENLLNKMIIKSDDNYDYVYHGYNNKYLIYSRLKGFNKELFLYDIMNGGFIKYINNKNLYKNKKLKYF